jgi:hypothetical protein
MHINQRNIRQEPSETNLDIRRRGRRSKAPRGARGSGDAKGTGGEGVKWRRDESPRRDTGIAAVEGGGEGKRERLAGFPSLSEAATAETKAGNCTQIETTTSLASFALAAVLL